MSQGLCLTGEMT